VHVTPVKTAVSGFDEPTAQPAQPLDYSHGVTKAFEANRNNLSGSRGLRKFGVAIQRGASSPIRNRFSHARASNVNEPPTKLSPQRVFWWRELPMNFSAGISSVCPSIYRSSLFLGRPTPQTPGHRPSRWKSAKKYVSFHFTFLILLIPTPLFRRYVSELCSPFTRVLQRRADLPRCRTSKKPLTPFRYKTRAEPAWVSFEPLSTKGKSTLCMASRMLNFSISVQELAILTFLFATACPSSPQPFNVM
jgi:hypothetical protein